MGGGKTFSAISIQSSGFPEKLAVRIWLHRDAPRIDRIELMFPAAYETYQLVDACWEGITLE